jgi:1-acyl-sn-glycerol-3-phosphate acyltransferase
VISWYHRVFPTILQLIAWYPGRLALHVFLSLKVTGEDNVRSAQKLAHQHKTGVIFCCTHVSEFDPIIVLSGVKPYTKRFPMFYVSAPVKEFQSDNYGWRNFFYNSRLFFILWGSFPLIRGTGDYAQSLGAHREILERGWSLCIFPEGGIKRKKPEPGGGVGYLAAQTGCVVIPVQITRTHVHEPPSFVKGDIRMTITYHEPVRYDSHDAADVSVCKEIAKDIMNRTK